MQERHDQQEWIEEWTAWNLLGDVAMGALKGVLVGLVVALVIATALSSLFAVMLWTAPEYGLGESVGMVVSFWGWFFTNLPESIFISIGVAVLCVFFYGRGLLGFEDE